MAKKTAEMSDKEYEQLTQNVHRELIKLDGHNTINVLHNQRIAGRSGQSHQIDVYWKFKVAGIVYQTAIECKQHKNHISIGKVRDFFGVLTDIGNISGIMITTTGYQKGALKFANQYGIKLLELRSATDKDLSGLIRKVTATMHLNIRQVLSLDTEISGEWMKNNHPDFLDKPSLFLG